MSGDSATAVPTLCASRTDTSQETAYNFWLSDHIGKLGKAVSSLYLDVVMKQYNHGVLMYLLYEHMLK